MSRLPTKRVAKTNGHARNDQGSTGNLFVTTKEPKPLLGLKKKLLELAKEEDLDYGLVISKLPQGGESRPDTALKLPHNPLWIYQSCAAGLEWRAPGPAL